MESLLYKLYNGEYEITIKQDEKLQKKLYAEWDKVQTMLGDEFVDRLLELEGERDDRRSFQYYQAGFRLGVRLLLEALTSATG